MSVTYTKGDIWNSGAPAIAHGVNCVGVMGGGVALQVRSRYPDLYDKYRSLCAEGFLLPGDVFIWSPLKQGLPLVINLATQLDLNGASLQWVNDSLRQLRLLCEGQPNQYQHIAMPQIGAGIGGLVWEDVAKLIELWFATSDTHIEVFEYVPPASTKLINYGNL